MFWRRHIIVIFLGLTVGSTSGFSFSGQDDVSPGTLALRYKKRSNIWARFDLGVVDAKITSRPPDTTKFDRRLEAFSIFGFDAALGPRFGLRMNSKAAVSQQRRSEQLPPRADVDRTDKQYDLEVDATFVTDKGLEIFAGVLGRHLPASEVITTTDTSEQISSFDAATIQSNRVGVVRRGGIWSGGFFYEVGGETQRAYSLLASDDTEVTGSETLFVPQRVGVFGEFVAAGFGWDFAFDFIKAAGAGPRDDQGNTVYTDHFYAKVGSFVSVGGTAGIYTALSHKTLSYASNAFVEMDTMPISTLRFLLMLGGQESHLYTGIIMGYGEDGQSLPEFNSSYEYRAVATTLGLFFPF